MVALESASSSKKDDQKRWWKKQTFRKFHKDNSSAVFSNYIARDMPMHCLAIVYFKHNKKKKQLYMYI